MATSASAPVLVVTDVAARLVRRGLLAPGDAARGGHAGGGRDGASRH